MNSDFSPAARILIAVLVANSAIPSFELRSAMPPTAAQGRSLNTPAHLILGTSLLARPGKSKVTAAALAGSMLPDLSLYLLAAYSLFILDISPSVVFGQLYFSEEWAKYFRRRQFGVCLARDRAGGRDFARTLDTNSGLGRTDSHRNGFSPSSRRWQAAFLATERVGI